MENTYAYPFTPMLLETAALPFDDNRYAFEVKYDGVRITAGIAADGVEIYNRKLNRRTGRYPEIAAQLCGFGACKDGSGSGEKNGATVLDGEIIALSNDGKPDFYRVMRRDRVENPSKNFIKSEPVYFMVFDIMEYNGSPMYDTEYLLRREVLESLFAEINKDGGKSAPNIKLVDSIQGSGKALFQAAKAEGLEGIIAKRLDSPYRTGQRSYDWLKIKAADYVRP